MTVAKRLAVAAIGVPALVVAMGLPAGADPGTIKVGDGGVSGRANDPHVGCQFGLLQFGMDGTPSFDLEAPTGGTVAATTQVGDEWVVTPDAVVLPHPEQGYHVRVTVDGKTKVIWSGPCVVTPEG